MLKVKLRKWGNSYGLRIPKQIMQMLSIKPDQEFKVEVKDDVIKLIKLESTQKPEFKETQKWFLGMTIAVKLMFPL